MFLHTTFATSGDRPTRCSGRTSAHPSMGTAPSVCAASNAVPSVAADRGAAPPRCWTNCFGSYARPGPSSPGSTADTTRPAKPPSVQPASPPARPSRRNPGWWCGRCRGRCPVRGRSGDRAPDTPGGVDAATNSTRPGSIPCLAQPVQRPLPMAARGRQQQQAGISDCRSTLAQSDRTALVDLAEVVQAAEGDDAVAKAGRGLTGTSGCPAGS